MLRPTSPLVPLAGLLLLAACGTSPGPRSDAGADSGPPDPNRCASGQLTCDPHATCLDGPSRCVCDQGWEGDGKTCQDVDECSNGTADCSPDATCTNFPGTYVCGCNPGFSGDGRVCVAINECAQNNGGCDPHAQCQVESDGSVQCTCDDGYLGDGQTCTAVSPCGGPNAQCDPHADCTGEPGGGYVCTCESGWQGNGFVCTVVDECATGVADCGPNSTCTPNTQQGGYTCGCQSGFAPVNGVCTDIDECTTGAADCSPAASCTNYPGGYVCTCPPGFTGDGVTCSEVDACAPGLNDCNDNATCKSTGPGLYTCTCASGYQGDGRVCTSINPCTNGSAHCAANSTCDNTGPGSFQCACNEEYVNQGGICVAVNACTSGTADCSPNATCTSTGAGTFTCACKAGWEGDGVTCTDINECANGTADCPANSVCVNTPGSYTCPCLTGFQQEGDQCVDIDECTNGTATCDTESTCVNTPGGWYCNCPPGFEGGANCKFSEKTLALGDSYACALGPIGNLTCWGGSAIPGLGGSISYPPGPELTPVNSGSGTWAVISTSATHACGVQTNGTLWCWGSNAFGELGDGTLTSKQLPEQIGPAASWGDVATGDGFTCGLQLVGTGNGLGGTLWCWGRNNVGQLGDGNLTQSSTPVRIGYATGWEIVVAGDHHACGMEAGQIYCWGGNEDGQAGLPPGSAPVTVPTLVSADETWQTLRAGAVHTCAVDGNGTLWCWGDNASGQLGTGSSASGPQQVGSSNKWGSVSGGLSHTCGVQTDESLWCWGDDSYGELGLGNLNDESTPQQVTSPRQTWGLVTAGDNFTCGESESQVSCWGSTDNARPGLGFDGSSVVPQTVNHLLWTQLAAGASSACAIEQSGNQNLWCWGDNTTGQLGDGTTIAEDQPEEISAGAGVEWISVAVGASHACGVACTGGSCAAEGTGALWCWGDNSWGQLGLPTTTTQSLTPQQIGSAADWVSVVAGADHTCALETTQMIGQYSLWCWGRNDSGQVGNGVEGGAAPMFQLSTGSGSTFAAVGAGDAHTCAIDRSGVLWCWGNNQFGQVGINSNETFVLSPAQVDTTITGWETLFLGTGMSCGIAENGDVLACWGLNNVGQLGLGNLFNQIVPRQVSPPAPGPPYWGTEPFAAAAGESHVCALDGSGQLWCWGADVRGEFGDGTSGNVNALPVLAAGGDTWLAVTAGGDFTCGLESQNNQGEALCFGLNNRGQLGDGNAWRTIPALQP